MFWGDNPVVLHTIEAAPCFNGMSSTLVRSRKAKYFQLKCKTRDDQVAPYRLDGLLKMTGYGMIQSSVNRVAIADVDIVGLLSLALTSLPMSSAGVFKPILELAGSTTVSLGTA